MHCHLHYWLAHWATEVLGWLWCWDPKRPTIAIQWSDSKFASDGHCWKCESVTIFVQRNMWLAVESYVELSSRVRLAMSITISQCELWKPRRVGQHLPWDVTQTHCWSHWWKRHFARTWITSIELSFCCREEIRVGRIHRKIHYESCAQQLNSEMAWKRFTEIICISEIDITGAITQSLSILVQRRPEIIILCS